MGINSKQPQRGFTLFEMLVVLVVVGLLTGIAVPSFKGFIERSRITTEVNRLVVNLNYARGTAVSEGRVTTMGRTSATNNDWSDGWEIYSTNTLTVGGAARGGADTLLKTIAASSPRLTVNGNGAAATYVSFRPNGMLNEAGSALISVCDANDDQQGRTITINLVGRVSVTDATTCSP